MSKSSSRYDFLLIIQHLLDISGSNNNQSIYEEN